MPFLTYNIALLLALLFYGIIHVGNRWIHHQIRWILLGSLALVTVTIWIDIPLISGLIKSGHLSLSLFILIMFAGVIKKTSIIYKRLLLVRGDLAILAFIFLLPHAIERVSLALYGYNSTGLLAMVIMLPLTLSSFMVIRKRIRPDRWKKLHKLAYMAYFLIYLHLGFNISVNPINVYIIFSPNSILYHILFLVYATFKSVKSIEKRNQRKHSKL